MAQAIKRFPIDASAKCNGTRSGVSMIRTSSVAKVADILFTPHTDEASLSNLDQLRLARSETNFKITLRATFTFDIHSSLLDHSPRFRHRRNETQFHQQSRQLPQSGFQTPLLNYIRRLLVTKHRIELFFRFARLGLGIEIGDDPFRKIGFHIARIALASVRTLPK